MSAELRAWVGVGLALLVQIVGGVWWASRLSTQNEHLTGMLAEMRQEMKGYAVKSDVDRRMDEHGRLYADHEARLRFVERNAKFGIPKQDTP